MIMIVSKVMNAPFISALNANKDCCKPRKLTPNTNLGLSADTLTFTSTAPQVKDTVELVFKHLNDVRKNSQLTEFFGTTKNKVNVFLREVSYGKTAIMTLTNGHFGPKSWAIFEIKRGSNKQPQISSLANHINSDKAAQIVKQNLENLK